MKKRQVLTYEIEEHFLTLGQYGNTTKELNLVSFNGNPAKFDLRFWKRDEDGEQALKGITLTTEDVLILRDFFNSLQFT